MQNLPCWLAGNFMSFFWCFWGFFSVCGFVFFFERVLNSGLPPLRDVTSSFIFTTCSSALSLFCFLKGKNISNFDNCCLIISEIGKNNIFLAFCLNCLLCLSCGPHCEEVLNPWSVLNMNLICIFPLYCIVVRTNAMLILIRPPTWCWHGTSVAYVNKKNKVLSCLVLSFPSLKWTSSHVIHF